MDINEARLDPAKIEGGEWVGEKYGTPIPDMGDLELKVRGMDNVAWRKLQSKLIAAVPKGRKQGNRLSEEEQDRIISACLLEASLDDWANMTDKGVAVPYSKEQAKIYLTDPQWKAFRNSVLWASSIVGQAEASMIEEDVKNSLTP